MCSAVVTNVSGNTTSKIAPNLDQSAVHIGLNVGTWKIPAVLICSHKLDTLTSPVIIDVIYPTRIATRTGSVLKVPFPSLITSTADINVITAVIRVAWFR